MPHNLLTDRAILRAKPKAKSYRLADGGSLYLRVGPNGEKSEGAKSWQFRYRIDGKPLTLSLGKYPRKTLADARRDAEAARQDIEVGRDPRQSKLKARLAKQAESAEVFQRIAERWVRAENKRQEWTPDYKREVEASIANHLSSLKLLPVADIDARVRATILDAMANTAPLMAEKVDRRLHGIMDYAVEQGWIKSNPLPRRRAKVQRKHYPAIVDPVQLGEVLRAARASDPAKAIMRAHLLLTFTAMRVSEVVGAKWEEFALHGVQVASGDHKMRRDPDAGNWSIPRSRMKRKDAERGPHVVPLPPELLAEMREWRTADGEGAMLVCPSPSDLAKPITPEGIEKFYRRTLQLAGKHSPHSWRSAFSTICREAGKSGDVIEAQLDHQVGSKIESAYDRATRLELRRELMRWYAGRLIAARDGATVLPLKGSA